MRPSTARFALPLCVALATPTAVACPAYVPAKDLPAQVQGPRGSFRLFARAADGKTGHHWTQLPVQVEALDDQGVLLPPPEAKGASHDAEPITPTDRLILRREGFAARAEDDAPPPCVAKAMLELKAPTTPPTYAYLASCADHPATPPNPVTHFPEAHKLDSLRFNYEYEPNNQLMYRSIKAKGPWGAPLVAGQDADLAVHFDITDFFTIDFTNRDVESYVVDTETGPVGVAASIDFFLRLLFFKINLHMSTTLGYYADSAHIPTIIDVPLDAPDRLNAGSGMIYSWTPKAASVDQSRPERTMPNADPPRILAGWQKSAKTALPYCSGDRCRFRLRGHIGTDGYGLDVVTPRVMTEHGFYPQWVADVGAFKKAMGWDDDPDDPPGTVGVYFDNSGLPKGHYLADQWMRIGDEATLDGICPRPVAVGTVRGLKPATTLTH